MERCQPWLQLTRFKSKLDQFLPKKPQGKNMSATLFKEVGYPLSNLMDSIEMGDIGLPDIQRPFVWKNAKVRDLFDSMYRGYPVGYFLFWENQLEKGVKQIGTNAHQKVPNLLIVDGQQRLTSLYAVLRGIPVVRENYESEHIEIAFRPLDGSFEVTDATTRRNPEYLPDVSKLFAKDASQYSIVGGYIERLKKIRMEAGGEFTDEEITKSELALQRLFGLTSFPFTALQLSANIDEEQVAEVFVRINSKGQTLNQADFILTLMSVFWEDGRKQLEHFCRDARHPNKTKASPFNYFVDPDPDQLLRVSIGCGFRRARLKYAYALLRGKDLETDVFSPEQREKQFAILQEAQQQTLNLQHWHDFFGILQQAGFRGSSMVSSKLTLFYAYTLYLIGRVKLGINPFDLNHAIGRWFFMAALTSRYTGGSPETIMERDLAALRTIDDGTGFLIWIDKTIKIELTDDFWAVNLPGRLETSSASSPLQFAYNAALNLLEARALFSKKKIWNALDPSIKAKKSVVERHHLFPKKLLFDLGIKEPRDVNQIANFSLVEWNDNIAISDSVPSDYYSAYCERFTTKENADMAYWHALPENWEKMSYKEFLEARRLLIARVIRDGFTRLTEGDAVVEHPETLEDKLAIGEGISTEFKATLRANLQTGEKDPRMEHAIVKTIAGFLNSRKGGTLIVGVADKGEVLGLDNDGFDNEDKMDLHLGNIIKSRLGTASMLHIFPHFEDLQHKRVLVVDCNPSNIPIYLKQGNTEEFYVRAGASSASLSPSQMTDYIKQRFG
ncbi:DUF262 domain-containing protein [Desulfocastanea catecholica]